MGQQPEDDRGQEKKPGQPAPAPWERRPAGSFKERMETGEQLYSGEEGEAGYLADDQTSLDSRLRGGGRDLGGASNEEYTKLCPACHTVTSFVQGKCSSCAYRDGDPLPDLPASFDSPGVNPALVGGLITVIVVILLVVLGFIYGPKLLAARKSGDGAEQPPIPKAEQIKPATTTSSSGHAGGLDNLTIDDAFKSKLAKALDEGSAAWEAAGKKCYVYRYNVFDAVVPATRQDITVTAYLGGKDAKECSTAPGDKAFQDALASWLGEVNSHTGVSTVVRLTYNPQGSLPSGEDHYLRYGCWYGKDHWSLLKPVVESLEAAKAKNGQYPDMLAERMLGGKMKTRGGLFFMSDGAGYLPQFKTDPNGNIIMGEGTGVAPLKPAECSDYYLFLYLKTESMGLDVYSPEDVKYYREKIQPFPYQPDAPVANAKLNPDGEPDGVACVIHNGELVE